LNDKKVLSNYKLINQIIF